MTEKLGMGWQRDYPDFRDYTAEERDSVKPMLARVGLAKKARASLPASADLRVWCSSIENHGSLGSCTANEGCLASTASNGSVAQIREKLRRQSWKSLK